MTVGGQAQGRRSPIPLLAPVTRRTLPVCVMTTSFPHMDASAVG
ncbi:hypothetical protein F750_0130 [Streptomyces sp. PAMC 26508]|nr:hypothetical protein F750_0130 [Streptomyces sp. PAMC 26508]